VPDQPARAARAASSDEVGDLKERVAVLELTVALLADQLVRSGVLDKPALGRAMNEARERAARMREEAESHVTCVSCGDVVHVTDSVERATGTLCLPCHNGTRFRREPPTETVRVEEGPYRGASVVTRAKTEHCAGCGDSVLTSEAYLSSRGALCAVCHAAAEFASDE
jgi:hypothetical protein